MSDPDEPSAPMPAVERATEVGEVLDTGQEEVFSRTEVELGRIEHCSEAGRKHTAPLDSPRYVTSTLEHVPPGQPEAPAVVAVPETEPNPPR